MYILSLFYTQQQLLLVSLGHGDLHVREDSVTYISKRTFLILSFQYGLPLQRVCVIKIMVALTLIQIDW